MKKYLLAFWLLCAAMLGHAQSLPSPKFNSFTLNGVTTHNVLIGQGNSPVIGISPSTSGLPMVSNGPTSDPSFQSLLATNANFNSGFTGSVTRTLQSRLNEKFSVKDFGATGNGSTDDTTSEQAAITAACSNGGGIVFWAPGTYKTSSLTLNCSNVYLVGSGRGATVIASNSTTTDTLVIGSTTPSQITNIAVESFTFAPSVTKTAGWEVHVEGNNSLIDLHDLYVLQGSGGILLDSYGSAILYKVHDVYFNAVTGNGLQVGTSNGLIQDVYAWDIGCGGCGTGLNFVNVSGFYFWDMDIVSSTGTGINFSPTTSGEEVVFGFLKTILSDTSTGQDWTFNPSSGTKVTDIHCSMCWAAGSHSSNAAILFNSAEVNGVTWDNGMVRSNEAHGIWMTAGSNITISNSTICNNSLQTASTYNGITVSSGVTGFIITGNTIGACGYDQASGSTNEQAYGIQILSSSTTNNFIVTNNRFAGNQLGGIQNGSSGANQVVTNNLNF